MGGGISRGRSPSPVLIDVQALNKTTSAQSTHSEYVVDSPVNTKSPTKQSNKENKAPKNRLTKQPSPLVITPSSAFNKGPVYSYYQLGFDYRQEEDEFTVRNPSSVFYQDSPLVVCVYKVDAGSRTVAAKGVWIAEDTFGTAPPNYLIDYASIEISEFPYSGIFTIRKPNNGWPLGTYVLEMFLDGDLKQRLPFTVIERQLGISKLIS
eukprot:GILK01005421.1.p1 GENE.GILK01005421.1~~GILK01005421.1.p1  ORF type:complete len:208 (-),score=22.21 GILK01005421.1:162-785(-)